MSHHINVDYKTVFNSASAGMAYTSESGVILDVNQAWLVATGFTREDAIGHTALELGLWANPEECGACHALLAQSGRFHDFETVLVMQSQQRTHLLSGQYVEWGGNRYVLWELRDISERKRREIELRDSTERDRIEAELARERTYLKTLIGTVPALIWWKDADGRYLGCNPRFEQFFGAREADICGKTDYDFVDKELADLFRKHDRLAMVMNGPSVNEEEVTFASDGHRELLETTKTPLRDERGRVIGVLGISHDITERKRIEVALRELEERYSKAFHTSPDAININRIPDGTSIEANESFLMMMGYARSEVIGKTSLELEIWVDPTARSQMLKCLMEDGNVRNFEAQFRKKSGETLWGLISASLIELHGEQCILSISRDISERKQAEQQIQFMAFNDVLTRLPNRQLFADRLQQAIALARRNKKLLAICYLDLDGFKSVNDHYGHQAGDELLVQLAERLPRELREHDTLARLGGDEFVILLNDLSSILNGEEILARLLQNIAQPYEVGGHRVHISASIGVTFFPNDESDPDTLLRHADQAMYMAKDNGKNTFRLYDPIQDQKAHTLRKALDEFEEALHQSQLVLHYQPRIDLRSGELAGVEALVRWQHPENGLIYPDQFLPLIENSPIEIALDEWVLKAALNQHMAWRKQGLIVPVSVNITSQHIQQSAFPEFLAKQLAAFSEPLASQLELEVLETSAIGDTIHVAQIMNACTKLGVKFSLDDFGTGYSSLTYFHHLPISVLKIDQRFVRDMILDPRDRDIVEGVLQLAKALNRPVVAEGVENIEIGTMLTSLGCQFAQGYGIARPMLADSLPAWSRQWRNEHIWHRH